MSRVDCNLQLTVVDLHQHRQVLQVASLTLKELLQQLQKQRQGKDTTLISPWPSLSLSLSLSLSSFLLPLFPSSLLSPPFFSLPLPSPPPPPFSSPPLFFSPSSLPSPPPHLKLIPDLRGIGRGECLLCCLPPLLSPQILLPGRVQTL